ncbi:MAG: LON peptidase substrate-binding domain-containing protein, partial [Desulfobulbaceae bacterium]|nr:LON peptidase substrate-binding domain-containing protein [Desulfobulbaceae bacterium]
MSEVITNIYPMMPLRDIVLFPHMVAPLVVGRNKSIKALEDAMASRKNIFLVTQKDSSDDDPSIDNIHDIGTIASVLQLLRLPDGTIKALVEGKMRGKFVEVVDDQKFFTVLVEEHQDSNEIDSMAQAFMREIVDTFKVYAKHNKKVPNEIIKSLRKITKP